MAERDSYDKGRRGGYAGAETLRTDIMELRAYAANGVAAGLLAGMVFMLMAMVLSLLLAGLALLPLRAAASVVLRNSAFDPGTSPIFYGLVGLGVHFTISGFWGLFFGVLVHTMRIRRSLSGLAVAGFVFGTVVWLVGFVIFAPTITPWLARTNQFAEFVLHALFYGLPLGAAFWKAMRTSPDMPAIIGAP